MPPKISASSPPAVEKIQAAVLKWYSANRRPLPWRTAIDRSPGAQCTGLPPPQATVPAILAGDYGVQSVTPYAVWVCEIMSQQTQIATLIPYWLKWMQRFPTVQALASADLDTVRENWAGLGYYRRAAFLHKGAQYLVEKHAGELPTSEAELLQVPGIGPYTAAAIASVCFDVCSPVVDGNVLRVITRFEGMKDADVKAKPTVDAVRRTSVGLIAGCTRPGDFNQGIMEIGATVCKPAGAPRCADCPLAALGCGAKRLLDTGAIPQIESIIPMTSKAKAKTVERYAAALFIKEQSGEFLLAKRPDGSGLLAGLWEVPQLLLDGATDLPTEVSGRAALLRRIFGDSRGGGVIDPRRLVSCGAVKHAFSHIDYSALVFEVSIDTAKAAAAVEKAVAQRLKAGALTEVKWVAREEIKTMAISTVAKKVLHAALAKAAPTTAKRSRSAASK